MGTTAITSALSSPETCNAKVKRTAQLIIETLPDLEKDVAMGDGTYVVALADTMGCSAQADAVTQTMRASYSQKVSSENYASQSNSERAYDMYDTARIAAKDAGCGAQL